ncbi:Glycosyl transferase, group 1 [Parvularcula bermudensis HTCC2503]|uniref:Glycosyl transferase, group 1 n=1 Tax=Parvularcula bermudensis (strain ATCC BAA-594 / HTCC2503 / KCTC 12087) TaxID=314260 RepID=E0TGL8_PARBH|nr:glycosyltransferase [Parvularcula bermudensis]ADM10150.1 Glycosyl transferase, group 1 [Parvularcula bermudensis HTCC2503]
MRVLVLTTLYPYPGRPNHGVFVENRIKALAALGHNIRVIAPIPWFPSRWRGFGDWARYADAPDRESRFGIDIHHPRYLILPKVGMTLAAKTLEMAFSRAIADQIADGFLPDLIDAHYYFPDGVAAAAAAEKVDIPVVITARGSDVTLLPRYKKVRRAILDASTKAAATITVSEALRTDLTRLGAAPASIHPIRNGVDLERFSPDGLMIDRTTAPVLLSVGHLIPRKGHDIAIGALARLPQAVLVIVGTGPEEKALKDLAARLGVAHRVFFRGQQPHSRLPLFYRGADVLILASTREGWPNVLLEAMACGAPCVASDVGGNAEVIASAAAGRIVKERTPDAFADAIADVLASGPARSETRLYAEGFDWRSVARRVETVWQEARGAVRHGGWGLPSPLFVDGKARCVLTIDTEECFSWDGDYGSWTLPPVSAVEAIQAAAETAGVKPLYFVTFPLLEDDAIGHYLAGLHHEGRAYCGIHFHSWATPPGQGPTDDFHSYQHNLTPHQHRAKLDRLIEAFEFRFGEPPIAHRAGRYGCAPWVLDQLMDRGIYLDFSPSAGFDFRGDGGPNYAHFPTGPRFRRVGRDTQWVIPVSGARVLPKLSVPLPKIFSGGQAPFSALSRTITTPVRLTPEGNDIATMLRLARMLLAGGDRLLTPTLHLSTLVPGATHYAATPEEVRNLLKTLTYFLMEVQKLGATPTDLLDLDHAAQRDRRVATAWSHRQPKMAADSVG